MRGIRRETGAAPDQKAAATADRLRDMLATLPDTLTGKRDRALLALGMAGAFRRSELVGLEVRDLVRMPEGLQVTIRRSKTDQEGRGQVIAILRGSRLRPVRAVQDWLETAGIADGPVFRAIDRHGRVSAAACRRSQWRWRSSAAPPPLDWIRTSLPDTRCVAAS